MRILFITATYLPTVNGVAYQIEILKKALEKLGHKVFVLAPSFPGHTDKDKNVIRYPSIPNPISKKYPVGLPLITPTFFKKIRPDIIHVHHPSFIGQSAAMLAESLKIPLVFTAHTNYQKYLHLYFPYGKRITSQIIKSSLKNLSKKCFRVVCPSGRIKKEFERNGIKNTTLIQNSIEEEFFRKPARKTYKIPTLVYTGRIDKEKDPFFLIQIAKELKKLLPNFKLIIIGDGQLLDSLEEKIFLENLGENINLTGDVSRKFLSDIYKGCHIFVTPSVTEVMPLSIIEAMASGLPVIALKRSGLEDLVIHNQTGFLLPKNPKAIAKKIASLFENQGELKNLSKHSYIHALNFSVENKSKELERLYKKAISGN